MKTREEQLEEGLKLAVECLGHYADPRTYMAVAFLFDPPCGDISKDFSFVESFGREMPGAEARRLLEKLQAMFPYEDERDNQV